MRSVLSSDKDWDYCNQEQGGHSKAEGKTIEHQKCCGQMIGAQFYHIDRRVHAGILQSER